MNDDELRRLLRSPALVLEPPSTLPADVRHQARRHRARRRLGGAGAALAVVAVAVLAGPALVDSVDSLRSQPTPADGFTPPPGFPAATSEVVTLQTLNGAKVLTWFEGSDWCTKTTRVTRLRTCVGPVDPDHQAFSWLLPAGSPSLTVDDKHVVAGIAPPGAARVVVRLRNGHDVETTLVDGGRFPTPVWSTVVDDRHSTVAYYAAFDAAGREIARKLS
jgi:hypothetical protein